MKFKYILTITFLILISYLYPQSDLSTKNDIVIQNSVLFDPIANIDLNGVSLRIGGVTYSPQQHKFNDQIIKHQWIRKDNKKVVQDPNLQRDLFTALYLLEGAQIPTLLGRMEVYQMRLEGLKQAEETFTDIASDATVLNMANELFQVFMSPDVSAGSFFDLGLINTMTEGSIRLINLHGVPSTTNLTMMSDDIKLLQYAMAIDVTKDLIGDNYQKLKDLSEIADLVQQKQTLYNALPIENDFFNRMVINGNINGINTRLNGIGLNIGWSLFNYLENTGQVGKNAAEFVFLARTAYGINQTIAKIYESVATGEIESVDQILILATLIPHSVQLRIELLNKFLQEYQNRKSTISGAAYHIAIRALGMNPENSAETAILTNQDILAMDRYNIRKALLAAELQVRSAQIPEIDFEDETVVEEDNNNLEQNRADLTDNEKNELYIELCKAVDDNDIEKVKELLELGTPVNKPENLESGYFAPLESALMAKNVKLIQTLLHYGADLNKTLLGEQELITNTLYDDDPDLFILLITNSSNLDTTQILSLAIYESPESVKKWVINGLDPNAVVGGSTLLIEAIKWGGDPDLVQFLLEYGADPNLIAQDNGSSFMASLNNDDGESLPALLMYGLNPNLKLHDGTTPMKSLSDGYGEEWLKLFIEHGGIPTPESIELLIWQCETEAVKYLLDLGTQVPDWIKPSDLDFCPELVDLFLDQDITDPYQLLDQGCSQQMWPLVRKALRLGVKIQNTGSGDSECVVAALKAGEYDIVDLMLTQGASADYSGYDYGVNYLTDFICNGPEVPGKANLVGRLRKSGASTHGMPFEGGSLLCAIQQGRIDIVRALLNNDAEWQESNKDGTNPLMLACALGQVETVKLLLENGAYWHVTDKNDRNSYDYVLLESPEYDIRLKQQKEKIKSLLIEYGAYDPNKGPDMNTDWFWGPLKTAELAIEDQRKREEQEKLDEQERIEAEGRRIMNEINDRARQEDEMRRQIAWQQEQQRRMAFEQRLRADAIARAQARDRMQAQQNYQNKSQPKNQRSNRTEQQIPTKCGLCTFPKNPQGTADRLICSVWELTYQIFEGPNQPVYKMIFQLESRGQVRAVHGTQYTDVHPATLRGITPGFRWHVNGPMVVVNRSDGSSIRNFTFRAMANPGMTSGRIKTSSGDLKAQVKRVNTSSWMNYEWH